MKNKPGQSQMALPQMMSSISPARMAVLAALVPAILFVLTYVLAAINGHVGWCLPPAGTCTDITHTGLQPPESFVFRVGMVIVCGILFWVWRLAGAWFSIQADSDGASRRARRIMVLGMTASLALLFSELMLQGSEETAWILHSLGASIYFLCGYAAQVLATIESGRLAQRVPGLIPDRSLRWKRWIVGGQTLILLIVIVGRLLGIREIGRPAQWIGSYLMLAYYLSFALDWRGRLEAGTWFRDATRRQGPD